MKVVVFKNGGLKSNDVIKGMLLYDVERKVSFLYVL